MQRKKVLIVIGSLAVGGTETFLVRYLAELIRQGWTVEIFTLAYHPGVLAETLACQGAVVTPILTKKDADRLSRFPVMLERIIRISLSIIRLIVQLKKEKHSILHLFLPEAYVLGMMAALCVGFKGPKVMSRRSLNYYQRKRPFIAWLERRIHHATNIIIGNSTPVIAQLQSEGIAKEKLRLIYNGLDINKPNDLDNLKQLSKSQLRFNFGITNNELVFIIVANLIPYKGHADLLQALHQIKKEIKQPWKLICVGRDQGILQALQHLAKEYQIDQNILWLGERKDVQSLLTCADIGILCSHEEGFSNAILEGMASGLPMVVTDVGGNGEAVLHGATGYVVPVKAPEALGQALLQLALDKKQQHEFGKNAKTRVESHFTLEKCVAQHIQIYEMLA